MRRLFIVLSIVILFVTCDVSVATNALQIYDPNEASSSRATFEELRAKAERGDAEAQYQIGAKYYQGDEVEKDYQKAFQWFLESAEQNNATAQWTVGRYYAIGTIVVDQDFKEAVKWYTEAADQGCTKALCDLSQCYYNGNGVQKDQKMACSLILKAGANEGDTVSQYFLGQMFSRGDGVAQDYEEAIKWYSMAAERGYADAQACLGFSYMAGHGVKQDYKQAAEWYTKAAEQGLASAQSNLGNMYYDGCGVVTNLIEAVKWYKKAAEQGDRTGQYHLALMYYKGEGVLQDDKKATKWFTEAAEQGLSIAQSNLGLMYFKGLGVSQDYKRAAEWYTKAAKQGLSVAQSNLGLMYAHGQGVIEDYVQAYKWTLLAGMNGKDVSGNKSWLKEQMTIGQVDEAQRLANEFVKQKQKPVNTASSGNSNDEIMSFGTGFFISRDGYFMTAAHVVKGANSIKVYWGEHSYPAKKIIVDEALDAAVLKVMGIPPVKSLSLQNSSKVKTGDIVFTLGFPQIQLQGIEAKYTNGSISSLSGLVNDPKYFQISVPIQPGNSGGPLLDSGGNVVGLITSSLDDVNTFLASGAIPQNVNYAIKSSFVLPLLESKPDIKLKEPLRLNREEAIEKAKDATGLVICSK